MFSRSTFGVVLAVASFPLSFQTQTFGELTGVVNDATGAIMAAATVTVTKQLTGDHEQHIIRHRNEHEGPHA